MVERQKGKIIKCDQKVNITAAFGAELVLEGTTAIPNILLKIYNKLGISDFQLLLLIQIIRLSTEERELYPGPEKLAACMEAEPARIREELVHLQEKEVIAVSDYFDSDRKITFEGYDLEPLFLKVSDIWAGIRAKEIEEAESFFASDHEEGNNRFDTRTGDLLAIFENEFGRPLSPIEIEQIEQWAAERDPELVVEALKQAVLRGKHNFNYINTILLSWKKNNLRTLREIAVHDQEFQNRRSRYSARREEAGKGDLRTGEEKTNSRKKDFIKTLYL